MGAKLGQVKSLPAGKAGYQASALNALKHGVLSRHAVLPHEDRASFDELVSALIAEHDPQGPTELHLVEELAGVMWRKRRVLLAEGAKYHDALRMRLAGEGSLGDAVPTDRRLAGAHFAKAELLTLTDETKGDYIEDVRDDLAHTERAEKALEAGGPDAYRLALAELREDSRGWWDSARAISEYGEADYQSNAEGLAEFIADKLRPELEGQLAAVEHLPAIAANLEGTAAVSMANNTESLQRYETHLDRKLERTLAMLIRLKELRHQ